MSTYRSIGAADPRPLNWLRLLAMSLVSFSSHYFRSSFSVIAVTLLERGFFTIQGYSVLQSSSYIPDILLPMAFGLIFDNIRDNARAMLTLSILFQVISLCGIIMFAAALETSSFDLTFVAFIVFGMGAICGNTCQRYCIAYEFNDNIEISTLIYITLANVSKITAKLMASYLAIEETVESQVGFGVMSFFLSVVAAFMATTATGHDVNVKSSDNATREDATVDHLPLKFWVYVMIHGLYLIIFHTFTNFLPLLISLWDDASLLEVGFYSSLSSAGTKMLDFVLLHRTN